ncbi:hypothetical protein K432DRAFT_439536 [Lepidopterella palustris CBS 459.81]|uniref:Exonuclease domain-containing protein n=1 Tax=Lepidopterella palustris CBS 459.81 TaxID=1314670 RepID=A0A8E2JJL7_9PEZI|nr:hypothetical protein K432DRAFT_439536 [Lepidopterella palustris CBS 459.81]
MGRGRKRSRHEYEADNQSSTQFGLGATLSQLNNPNGMSESKFGPANGATDDNKGGGDEWHTVGKGGRVSKKQKPSGKEGGNYPAITHSPNARLQHHTRISELQALALYILADGTAPQWVSVRHHTAVRQVVVLMVPGLEAGMFTGKIPLQTSPSAPTLEDRSGANTSENLQESEKLNDEQTCPKNIHLSPDDYYPVKLDIERLAEPLKPLAGVFSHIWPIRTPGDDKTLRIHSPVSAMLTSPIPKSKEEKMLKKDPRHKGPIPRDLNNWQSKRTPITEYIANHMELQENEYVIHPAWFTTTAAKEEALRRRKAAKQTAEDGWVDTVVAMLEDGDVPEREIEAGSLTAGRNVVTMDCEMCKTAEDRFELTRISLVAWDGSVILDELVKPENPITDYVTAYSGITEAMLENVTTTLSDIQKRLLELITPRTVLVGHSLNSDLNALKLTHPFIVDTSIIYPHSRGPPLKQSLKWLSQKYLSRDIQKKHGMTGHDSVEDARACLDLVKQKCEKGHKWGTSDASSESIFKRLGRYPKPKFLKSHADADEFRMGAVIDWGDPSRGYGAHAHVAIGCNSDADVVEGIKKAVSGHVDGQYATMGAIDFVWGRLRELEVVRGWWSKSKTEDDTGSHAVAGALSHPEHSDPVVASGSALGEAVAKTVKQITDIYASLPACTAFIVYSGSGDTRETARLQAMQQQFRKEYAIKKWDELSVKWTDTEEQALRKACKIARDGIGFIAVK